MDNNENSGRKRDKFAAAIKNILRVNSTKDVEDTSVHEQMRDYVKLGSLDSGGSLRRMTSPESQRRFPIDSKKYKSTPTGSLKSINQKDLKLDIPAAIARTPSLNRRLERPLSHPDTASLMLQYELLDSMIADNIAMMKDGSSSGSSRTHSIQFDNSSSDEDDYEMDNNFGRGGLIPETPDGRRSVKIGERQMLSQDIPEGRLLFRFESLLEAVTDLVSKMSDDEEKINFISDLQYNLSALRGLVEDNVNMAVISSVLLPPEPEIREEYKMLSAEVPERRPLSTRIRRTSVIRKDKDGIK